MNYSTNNFNTTTILADLISNATAIQEYANKEAAAKKDLQKGDRMRKLLKTQEIAKALKDRIAIKEAKKAAKRTEKKEARMLTVKELLIVAGTMNEKIAELVETSIKAEKKPNTFRFYTEDGSYKVVKIETVNDALEMYDLQKKVEACVAKNSKVEVEIGGIFDVVKHTVLWNMSKSDIVGMLMNWKHANRVALKNKKGGEIYDMFFSKYTFVSEFNVGDVIRRQEHEDMMDMNEQSIVIDGDEGLTCAWPRKEFKVINNKEYLETFAVDAAIDKILRDNNVEAINFEGEMMENTTNPTGYCHNFNCITRVSYNELKTLKDAKAALQERVRNGNIASMNLYKKIVDTYGNFFIRKMPTVVRGSNIMKSDNIYGIKNTKADGERCAVDVNTEVNGEYTTITGTKDTYTTRINRRVSIGVANDCETVRITDAQFKFSHDKRGNVNREIQMVFTENCNTFAAGIAMFNSYAADISRFNTFKTAIKGVWGSTTKIGFLGEIAKLNLAIKECEEYYRGYENKDTVRKEFRNKAALVHVDYIVNSRCKDNSRGKELLVAICPYCGCEVRLDEAGKSFEGGVKSWDVISEMKDETYNFGDREVTLGYNRARNIIVVNDTNSEAKTVEQIAMDIDNDITEVVDAVTVGFTPINNKTNADDEGTNDNYWTETDVNNTNASDYRYNSITSESMQAFYDESPVTAEELETYNNIMKGHKNLDRWNAIRNGMSTIEAAWITSIGSETNFIPGGFNNSEFYNYEEEVIRLASQETGIEGNKFDNCDSIIKFKDIAALAMSNEEDYDAIIDSMMSMQYFTDDGEQNADISDVRRYKTEDLFGDESTSDEIVNEMITSRIN
ncbi:MAG: hypothetical protein KAS32_09665 [Candidatus Peribacteraceae bacterium]|nr:hypothetical protein [Candidatus Peribacteraceae bacterium]